VGSYIGKFEIVRNEADVEESDAKEAFWLGLQDDVRETLETKLTIQHPRLMYKSNKHKYVTLREIMKVLRAEKFFEKGNASAVNFKARTTRFPGKAKGVSFLCNADPLSQVNTVMDEAENTQLHDAVAAVYAASVPSNVGAKKLKRLLPKAVAALEEVQSRGLPALQVNWLDGLHALSLGIEHSYNEAMEQGD